MAEHSRKGDETTIVYGGLQNIVEEMERSGRLITSYGGLLNQSSALSSEGLGQKDTTDQLSENDIPPSSSGPDGAAKNNVVKTKKGSSNNFPTNVKSLLSTGILDGVPVKYVSWSREVKGDYHSFFHSILGYFILTMSICPCRKISEEW